MRRIDEQFLETPFYGARQMMRHLRRSGHCVGRARVRRLMRRMGLAAAYQKPRTSVPHPDHAVFPYLLRGLSIERVNQVWSADISYIPMRRGFLYLVAVMDWASRKVLSWRVSNTMEVDFYIAAVEYALARFGRPEIFNTDRGSQFTSPRFVEVVQRGGTLVSMDGRGRWLDNVFIERLSRPPKYECVYLHAFETSSELRSGLTGRVGLYNARRPHSALAGRTPDEVYEGASPGPGHGQAGGVTINRGFSLARPPGCPKKWGHLAAPKPSITSIPAEIRRLKAKLELPMYEFDAAVTHAINSWAGRGIAIDLLMIWISTVGVPVLVLAVAWQWWRRPDRLHRRHVFVAAGFSFLLGLAFNQLILLFVHRIRPYDAGVSQLLIARSSDPSFPSDHATATFAVAVAFLLHGMRRMGLGFLAAALLMILSRVYIGTHYASDVLGGALTGIVAAAVVRSIYWEGTRADRFITGLL